VSAVSVAAEPSVATPTLPSVSVVIPTYNRLPTLRRVLAALSAQDYGGPLEAIVVSDGSDDGTDEYLDSGDAPVPVVACRQPNAGPASARNSGVQHARGEIIVFLDDDVVPTPSLVSKHVEGHLRLGDRVVVIGPMLNPPDHEMSMWVRYEQAMLEKQYHAMMRGDWAPTARQFYTGNASVRRNHLIDVGGFDTQLRRAEDVELAQRLADRGIEFAYEAEAVGLHYAERSFESWRAIAEAYGRNDVLFSRRPGHSDVLTYVTLEYRHRRALTRAVVRVAAGRPRIQRIFELLSKSAARAGGALGLDAVSRVALSGIYNVAYYSGVMAALGGRSRFWRARRRITRDSAARIRR
jgi:glycosyltransferase involved in cell wall biosynthesis